jgi:hypothetical protein
MLLYVRVRGVVSASAAVSESRVSSVGAPGVLSVKEHHHQLRAKVVSMMPEGSVIYLEVRVQCWRNLTATSGPCAS